MTEAFPARIPREFPHLSSFTSPASAPPALGFSPAPRGMPLRPPMQRGPSRAGGVQAEPPPQSCSGATHPNVPYKKRMRLVWRSYSCGDKYSRHFTLAAFVRFSLGALGECEPTPRGCSLPPPRAILPAGASGEEPLLRIRRYFKNKEGAGAVATLARGCWQRSTSRFLSARHSPGFLTPSWP